MLQCFVCLFMFLALLISEIKCFSSRNQWNTFEIDYLNLTMDFGDVEDLASIFGSYCENTELGFEFEVDWDEIVSNMVDKIPSADGYEQSESKGQNKVWIITACTAAALAVAIALFIYGKQALISYLQSGSYRVPEDSKRENGFHELPEVLCRKI